MAPLLTAVVTGRWPGLSRTLSDLQCTGPIRQREAAKESRGIKTLCIAPTHSLVLSGLTSEMPKAPCFQGAFFSRGDMIRTCDLLVPNQAL